MILEGKITRLLSTLSTTELRRLGEYVNSPYFNKNNKVVRLFELLRKKHPHYQKIKKENLFYKVFKDKKEYNDGLFRALISDLSIICEKFMAQSIFEENSGYQELWLLEYLSDTGLNELFEKKMRKVLLKQENESVKDSDFYYLAYLMKRISYRHTTLTKNRAIESSLQQLIDDLDRYYLAAKLKYTAIALNRQRIVDFDYELTLLAEIQKFLQSDRYIDTPAVNLYHKLVLALDEFDNDTHFVNLKNALFKDQDTLPQYERRQLFTALLNYCRWKINLGRNQFKDESFQIYRFMLDEDILIRGGYIPYNHFRNVVRVGLEMKDFAWTENFIQSYKDKITEKVRENVYAFTMASLNFEKKEFDLAMEFLREIQFSEMEFIDFYYHMYYKTLLIQTAFELEEVELVYATLESFRMYLRRNKAIPPDFKEAYNNFTKLVKKVQNTRVGGRVSQNLLSEEIQNLKPLVNREWLLEIVT